MVISDQNLNYSHLVQNTYYAQRNTCTFCEAKEALLTKTHSSLERITKEFLLLTKSLYDLGLN